MTTEQAKNLSEDALSRLMQALEEAQGDVRSRTISREVPIPPVTPGHLHPHLQPATGSNACCRISRLAEAGMARP
jgi:hypothetical protein